MAEPEEPIICAICLKPIPVKVFPNGKTWAEGNNAEPVARGRCCDKCDEDVVIPTRIAIVLARRRS